MKPLKVISFHSHLSLIPSQICAQNTHIPWQSCTFCILFYFYKTLLNNTNCFCAKVCIVWITIPSLYYAEGRIGPKVAFCLKLTRICSISALSMVQRKFNDLFQAISTTNVQENTAFWGSKLLAFECDLCWPSNLAPQNNSKSCVCFSRLSRYFGGISKNTAQI